MGRSAPWYETYLNYCILTPNFDHQTLTTKPLYYLNFTPVYEKQTLITISQNKLLCLMIINKFMFSGCNQLLVTTKNVRD